MVWGTGGGNTESAMWDFFDFIGLIVELVQKWRFTLAVVLGVSLGWLTHLAFGSPFGVVAWVLLGLAGGVWGVIWQTRSNPS